MKRNLSLIAFTLFPGLLLVTCGDETTGTEDSGHPARIEIVMQGSAGTKTGSFVNTRSHGTLPSGTGLIGESEGTVNRVTVGVFKTDGTADVISEATSLSAENTLTVTATEGSREIIVIANAPAAWFAGITTKTEFLANAVSLAVTTPDNLGEAPQLTNNLPMSGQATTESEGSVTTIELTQATTVRAFVKLTRLVSRVSISSISCSFAADGPYPTATFTPAEVFLYQVRTRSTWDVGTAFPTTTQLGQGESSTNGSSDYLVYLGESISSFSNGSPFAEPYFFYTFANNDALFPTKLIIKGTFDANGNSIIESADGDGTVYYPIVINKSQPGTVLSGGNGDGTLDRNKTYALTATIKGKGVPAVNENINPADVSLTVNVEAWALDITQNVTFE